MYYNEGCPVDIVAIYPQGTNSTMFTQCCEVAITDSESRCPVCKKKVIGADAETDTERHKMRWFNATRWWNR